MDVGESGIVVLECVSRVCDHVYLVDTKHLHIW